MKTQCPYVVKAGTRFRLKDWPTDDTGGFKGEDDITDELEQHRRRLDALQDILSAECRYALLIVLQAMDTGGKDGTIRHIFTGVNPQGVNVTAFKAPTPEEAKHDYLWRIHAAVPRLGTIGIFNRSYYEEVLIVPVDPRLSEDTRRNWPFLRDRRIDAYQPIVERFLTPG